MGREVKYRGTDFLIPYTTHAIYITPFIKEQFLSSQTLIIQTAFSDNIMFKTTPFLLFRFVI